MDTAQQATLELLEQLADRISGPTLTKHRALGKTAPLLNHICLILVANRTEVTPTEKETLTRLLDVVPAGDFDYLHNREQTLSAIKVADQPRVVTDAELGWLHTKSRELLERFADRLPPDALENFRTLVSVGEPTFMLNLLCGCLVNNEISVTPDERRALAELLNWFRQDTDVRLAYIHDRENTLASLNVADQS